MSNEPVFKVLCIDGGGIKGIYSSKILEIIEQKYNVSIVDYFDLICGTSTGGLLGLALSLKIPAKEITEFYQNYGKEIFPNQNRVLSKVKQAFFGGKYNNKKLEENLKKVFGENKIKDSNCLLCIPTYSITDGRPYIFKYDHPEGKLIRDNNTYYKDVALATSAAPTYFPIIEIKEHPGKQFIDGGVYSNNPTFIGFTEALDYFVGDNKKYKKFSILSVSSLEIPEGKGIEKKLKKALWDWKNDLVNPFMTGQSHIVNYSMKKLSQKSSLNFNYVRIPSPVITADQCKLVQLDNASENALNFMKGKGNDQGIYYFKLPEVEDFFTTKKSYILK